MYSAENSGVPTYSTFVEVPYWPWSSGTMERCLCLCLCLSAACNARLAFKTLWTPGTHVATLWMNCRLAYAYVCTELVQSWVPPALKKKKFSQRHLNSVAGTGALHCTIQYCRYMVLFVGSGREKGI